MSRRSFFGRLVPVVSLWVTVITAACDTPAGTRSADPVAPDSGNGWPAGQDWTGRWTGELTNVPTRPGAVPVDVVLEIGPYPAVDSTCADWRTTYSENGEVKGVKDYRFCRGTGEDDLYIDEGDGIRLTSRWIGDVLVSPFKYGNLLLVTSARLRQGVLEEEILTIDDRPATDSIVTLLPRAIQRLTFRRDPAR